MLSTVPEKRWTLASASQDERLTTSRLLEVEEKQRQLSKTGRTLLTEYFVRQLRSKISDQRDILELIEHSREWALELMFREFHSVRAASTLLQQHNMASVAARGEVLVQLLKHGIVALESHHKELLDDTLHLLSGILDRIERDGSDYHCFSTARTAVCLYAAAEPATRYYEPSRLPRLS